MQEALEDRSIRAVKEALTQQEPLIKYSGMLRWAAEHNCPEAVRLLLADGRGEPFAYGGNGFYCAASKNYVKIVALFLADPRVDPSADYNWAVRQAAMDGAVDAVQLLLTDPRVDASRAIPWAKENCARVLAADERFGVERQRELYVRHHPDIVRQYDAMISQCLTMAWLAEQVITWSDIVWPLSDRLKAALSN